MIPFIEEVVIQYLKDEIPDTVASSTPENTSQTWVKVELIDTRQVSATDQDFFNAYHLQVDCYPSEGGPAFTTEAFDLYQAVRAALSAMPEATITGAVVTAVRFGGGRRLADTAFDKPRQRYILDVFVHAHA